MADLEKAAAPAPADTLSAAVVEAFRDDFARHGRDAVERLRKDDLKSYMGLVCRLTPARPREDAGFAVVHTIIDLAGPHG